ncbi:hypothetical protein [Clostridium paridis]|uniref:Uncharacterized protein n=1 Tax=Clostridium paridis TaxID=2803863 RepID=A0A937FH13_9CLOT|nr:hypothetical protein [Clostridium paridis]MBL4932845.1 hypothetical protein [Clostridium paridis]
MDTLETLVCKECNGTEFKLKRRATYEYTYDITSSSDLMNSYIKSRESSFLFDNRENLNETDYLICNKCNCKYTVDLRKIDNKINLTIVKKALTSENKEIPEFLG